MNARRFHDLLLMRFVISICIKRFALELVVIMATKEEPILSKSFLFHGLEQCKLWLKCATFNK